MAKIIYSHFNVISANIRYIFFYINISHTHTHTHTYILEWKRLLIVSKVKIYSFSREETLWRYLIMKNYTEWIKKYELYEYNSISLSFRLVYIHKINIFYQIY